jgi:hypothetical protein
VGVLHWFSISGGWVYSMSILQFTGHILQPNFDLFGAIRPSLTRRNAELLTGRVSNYNWELCGLVNRLERATKAQLL